MGVLARYLHRDEHHAAGVEGRPAEIARGHFGQPDDAVAARGEGVAQIAGYGEATRVRRPEPACQLSERRVKTVELLP